MRRSGIEVLADFPGTGPDVQRLHNSGENPIAGRFHGVAGMRVGGTRNLRIPPHLAYGGADPRRTSLLLAAEAGGVLVGFGKARTIGGPDRPDAATTPEGHYLTGVVSPTEP